MFYNTV